MARRCYNVSMEILKVKKGASKNCSRLPNSSRVMLVDLDAREHPKIDKPMNINFKYFFIQVDQT